METADYHRQIAEWRSERDRFFKEHYASPLSDEATEAFAGLDYFDVDEALIFETRLDGVPEATLQIDSSTGSVLDYPVAGAVVIQFGDDHVSLIVLRGDENEMYIPFRDTSCGVEVYGGGRYVSVDVAGDGSCTVDFNRAINPYCAYDPEFSCPLPPQRNWLNRRIAAGEKDYH